MVVVIEYLRNIHFICFLPVSMQLKLVTYLAGAQTCNDHHSLTFSAIVDMSHVIRFDCNALRVLSVSSSKCSELKGKAV